MAFMEQSYDTPSESKGSGGDPMSAWRERRGQSQQRKSYGSSQGSAPAAAPSAAPDQPMRSRYGRRGGMSDGGAGGGVPQASQDRMIDDVSSGRATGPDNQMSPPAFGRGGRFGGSMGMPSRDFGGRMGAFQDRIPMMADRMRRAPGRMGDRFADMGDMGSLRERFANIMRQRQMQQPGQFAQPAPRPTGLGGLVAANNANIRGRGGELMY